MIEVYQYEENILEDKNNRKKICNFLKKKLKNNLKIIMIIPSCKETQYKIQKINQIYPSLIIKEELIKKI